MLNDFLSGTWDLEHYLKQKREEKQSQQKAQGLEDLASLIDNLEIRDETGFQRYLKVFETTLAVDPERSVFSEPKQLIFVEKTAQKLKASSELKIDRKFELLRAFIKALEQVSAKGPKSEIVSRAHNRAAVIWLSAQTEPEQASEEWSALREFVLETELPSEELITAVYMAESRTRLEPSASVELALLTSDASLKQKCLQNAIKVGGKAVFKRIEEKFVKTDLFDSVIVPFAKTYFLELLSQYEEESGPETGVGLRKSSLKEVETGPSEEDLHRQMSPLLFCVMHKRKLLDFFFETVPGAAGPVQRNFLKKFPILFKKCVRKREALLGYFQSIANLLTGEAGKVESIEEEAGGENEKEKETQIETEEQVALRKRWVMCF